jgi:hypothetical protein
MRWQDWVLSAGSIVFIIALIPSIVGENKPMLSSSVITGLVLVAFAAVYGTLSLWFATITTALTSVAWFILGGQKYREKKKSSRTRVN